MTLGALNNLNHYVGTIIVIIGALHNALVGVLVGIIKVRKSVTVVGIKLHKH